MKYQINIHLLNLMKQLNKYSLIKFNEAILFKNKEDINLLKESKAKKIIEKSLIFEGSIVGFIDFKIQIIFSLTQLEQPIPIVIIKVTLIKSVFENIFTILLSQLHKSLIDSFE